MTIGAEQGGQGPDMEALGAGSPTSSFGKYHLFASLGRGGMADVFLAVARGPMGFNKLAVVKRLRSNLADDPAFRRMFLDEARLAARLNHPNIVHTYEVGEQDGVYFIAMEYLEGQSLNKVIREAVKRNDVFDQAFCARVISDALAGLHHAHELRDYDGRPLNIIHRDVSPHNVFVTYGGQVKLVDFGIAKAALSTTETEVGVLKGKVAYMSPEQAMGSAMDCRADVFSMGIVLWELLSRQRLMTGDSAASTLHRLLNAPIPPVSSVRDDIDPELDAIVARALEKDPRYRFQTAQEMRDALDGFLAATGRNARQDEVGRKIGTMFQRVREDVQRQIQEHMATVTTAANTQELAALNAEALRRATTSGPPSPSLSGSSGNLMKLGTGSGSGSGIVANYGGGSQMSIGHSIPPRQDVAREQKKNRVLLLALALMMTLLAVAVVALLVIFLRPSGGAVETAQGTPGEGTAAATGPNAASAANAANAGNTNGVDTSATTAPSGAPTAGQPTTGLISPPVTGDTATAGAPGSTPTAPKPTPGAPTAHHATHAPSTTHEHTPPPPATTAPKDDDGFLTLSTYPWTKVTEGGKPLGTTPIVHLQLSAGAHVLTLENPDQGIKQTLPITIKSGETVSKSLAFK